MGPCASRAGSLAAAAPFLAGDSGTAAQAGCLLDPPARPAGDPDGGALLTWHPEILGVRQRRVVRALSGAVTSRGFSLGGGTAIALHLGHRRSVDLDWFRRESIPDPRALARSIRKEGVPLHVIAAREGGIHGALGDVWVDLAQLHYPLLRRPIVWRETGIRVVAPEDLAAMKIAALTTRGQKRDFVDVYALGTKRFSLAEMLAFYRRRYRVRDLAHVLVALSNPGNAAGTRLPRMLWDVTWPTIQATIIRWVRNYVRALDGRTRWPPRGRR